MSTKDQKLRDKMKVDKLAIVPRHPSLKSVGSSLGIGKQASGTNVNGKGDESILTSSSVHNSFVEIVEINEEGHPYIDINKLVYTPKHAHGEHKKDHLSDYLPDFSFIVFNFMSLGCSTYFILMGVTTLVFKASLSMFQLPFCGEKVGNASYTALGAEPRPPQEKHFYYEICWRLLSEYNKYDQQDVGKGSAFPILRTNLTPVHYLGLVLICLSLANVINVFIGIYACIEAIITFTSKCDPNDLTAVRVILSYHTKYYGTIRRSTEDESDKENLMANQVDELQMSLGCCGVDSWADYLQTDFPLARFTTYKAQLDETEMVIPWSCCQPWWIRNIYCSHGVHHWANPLATKEETLKFQERIVPEGCMYKLDWLCNNIRHLMGSFGFVTTFVHLVFVIIETVAALVLIQNINTLIRDKKREMKRKEMLHDDGDSDNEMTDHQSINSIHTHTKINPWTKVAPPTEDEIVCIRQRSNFNRFVARVHTSQVGRWMKEALEQVTEGHDDDEGEDHEKRKTRELKTAILSKKRASAEQEDNSVDELARKYFSKRHPHHHDKHKHDKRPSGQDLPAKSSKPKHKKIDQKMPVFNIKSRLDTGRKSRKSIKHPAATDKDRNKSRKSIKEHPPQQHELENETEVVLGQPDHLPDGDFHVHMKPEESKQASTIVSHYIKKQPKKPPKKIEPKTSVSPMAVKQKQAHPHSILHRPSKAHKKHPSVKNQSKKESADKDEFDEATEIWEKEQDKKNSDEIDHEIREEDTLEDQDAQQSKKLSEPGEVASIASKPTNNKVPKKHTKVKFKSDRNDDPEVNSKKTTGKAKPKPSIGTQGVTGAHAANLHGAGQTHGAGDTHDPDRTQGTDGAKRIGTGGTHVTGATHAISGTYGTGGNPATAGTIGRGATHAAAGTHGTGANPTTAGFIRKAGTGTQGTGANPTTAGIIGKAGTQGTGATHATAGTHITGASNEAGATHAASGIHGTGGTHGKGVSTGVGGRQSVGGKHGVGSTHAKPKLPGKGGLHIAGVSRGTDGHDVGGKQDVVVNDVKSGGHYEVEVATHEEVGEGDDVINKGEEDVGGSGGGEENASDSSGIDSELERKRSKRRKNRKKKAKKAKKKRKDKEQHDWYKYF